MAHASAALFAALLLSSGLAAQTFFDPASEAGRGAVEAFEKLSSSAQGNALKCTIYPFQPRLNYDLRVWTGYQFTFPAWQFEPEKRAVLINILKITPVNPERKAPVWLYRRWDISKIPVEATQNRKIELEAGGGFLVGSGAYEVDWLVIDDRDRACRKSWKINSNPPKRDKLGITPGLVQDETSMAAWTGPAATTTTGAKRATLLVNVYPTFRRRYLARLSWWDRRLLTTAITTTIDRGAFASARVVLFDLERRRVVFEDDNFGRQGYRRLMSKLAEADFATIDYSILKDGPSESEFLLSLLEAESRRDAPSDAVVFVTPAWRLSQSKMKVPPSVREDVPNLYCIALTSRLDFAVGSVVDFVKAGKGEVYTVFEPQDLAVALDKIQRELRTPTR